jgi:membrane protein implicated in regulation of membrane protease activity
MEKILAGISPSIAWACVGVVLIMAEVFSGAFVALFFGISALLVAVAVFVGLESLPIQLLLFAGLGFFDVLVFRKRLVASIKAKGSFVADRDQVITLSADVPAGKEASISYQGSPWTAFNESSRTLKAGSRAVILRTEGIRLIITGKSES